MQIINPTMLKAFRLWSAKYMEVNEINKQRGIAIAIISVIRKRRRKKNKTTAARKAPYKPLLTR